MKEIQRLTNDEISECFTHWNYAKKYTKNHRKVSINKQNLKDYINYDFNNKESFLNAKKLSNKTYTKQRRYFNLFKVIRDLLKKDVFFGTITLNEENINNNIEEMELDILNKAKSCFDNFYLVHDYGLIDKRLHFHFIASLNKNIKFNKNNILVLKRNKETNENELVCSLYTPFTRYLNNEYGYSIVEYIKNTDEDLRKVVNYFVCKSSIFKQNILSYTSELLKRVISRLNMKDKLIKGTSYKSKEMYDVLDELSKIDDINDDNSYEKCSALTREKDNINKIDKNSSFDCLLLPWEDIQHERYHYNS